MKNKLFSATLKRYKHFDEGQFFDVIQGDQLCANN